MFTGKRFEAINKSDIANATGFSASAIEYEFSYCEEVTEYINIIDSIASGFGYEFCGFTERCVIFKRIS
jgi:hypothetical protein